MNNLALVYVSLGAHVQAESLFKRVIAADSTLVHAYLTMAEQIAMQRRHVDARRVMDEATLRFPDHPVVHLTPIYLAASAQDWARAESLATARLNGGVRGIQRVDALQTLARIELLRGRVHRAQATSRGIETLALEVESPYRYLSGAITSAWLTLRYRSDAAGARTALERALKRVPIERVPEADRPVAALVAVMLASGMKEFAERVAAGVSASSVVAGDRAYIQGLLHVANGRASEGARLLAGAAEKFARLRNVHLPVLATARAASGDVPGAIRAAEDYLAAPDIHRFEPDAAELPELLTRLAGWYEQRGDVPHATADVAAVVALWANADATLSSRVADARRHVAKVDGR